MDKPLDIKRLLEDPATDRGNGIQEVARHHAQLLLCANIWQRPSSWLTPLWDREVLYQYAFRMYCRLIRRYQLQAPLPDETQPIDPAWWKGDPVRTHDGTQETEPQLLARMLYIASFGHELFFGGYLSNYVLAHVSQWNNRLIAEREQARLTEPVGKKISVHGTTFAYVCTACETRVNVSRLFQTEVITRAQATLEHAYCYCCYGGLDGSCENFHAYHVSPTENGQIVPSAFALLEVGLACDELDQEPTVARVHRNLWEAGMIWESTSVQAALHVIFPDSIAPVFV